MNRGIEVLQTFALPLGYGTIFRTEVLYHAKLRLSMGFAKFFWFVLGIHRICRNMREVIRLRASRGGGRDIDSNLSHRMPLRVMGLEPRTRLREFTKNLALPNSFKQILGPKDAKKEQQTRRVCCSFLERITGLRTPACALS